MGNKTTSINHLILRYFTYQTAQTNPDGFPCMKFHDVLNCLILQNMVVDDDVDDDDDADADAAAAADDDHDHDHDHDLMIMTMMLIECHSISYIYIGSRLGVPLYIYMICGCGITVMTTICRHYCYCCGVHEWSRYE